MWGGAANSEKNRINKSSGRTLTRPRPFLQLALVYWSVVQPRNEGYEPRGNMEPGGILGGRGGKFGVLLDWIIMNSIMWFGMGRCIVRLPRTAGISSFGEFGWDVLQIEVMRLFGLLCFG
jgi:hypothetical protein